MSEGALAVRDGNAAAALAEQVVIKGNLAQLTEEQRMSYYTQVCRSLGLNPLTRPFEYITLNNKLTLYATRNAADQLRQIRGITITSLDPRQVGDLLVVVATGRDRDNREDSATGAVSVKGLSGEALANAMMKAETKAKRRLTLSLAGLGWTDETEVASIPSAQHADVDPETGEIRRPLSLAEKAAQKAAEVQQPATEAILAQPMTEEESAGVDEDATIGLTSDVFKRLLIENRVSPEYAMSQARILYPNWDGSTHMTNEQRARVWHVVSPNHES